MTPTEELRRIKAEQIRAKREGAERARRLGQQFWSSEDRDRALKLAEELDAQADELERAFEDQLAAASNVPPGPKTTQAQVQGQQGPPAADQAAKDQGTEDPSSKPR